MQTHYEELLPLRPRAGGRILVAGGRAEDRALLRDALQADGHEVTLVRTATEALSRVAEAGYELLLLHARSASASTEILSGVAACTTPTILLVDGAAPAGLDGLAARLGLAGVLAEPYSLDDLRLVAASWVERAARRRGN